MNALSERQLPPSDRTETLSPAKAVKTFPCDEAIRSKLMELRDSGAESNNTIALKTGKSASIVSQYLHPKGCTYSGNVGAFERKVVDMLRNEARRRASGVETIDCQAAKEMRTAFEYIRKTNDVGVIIGESGDGKSRGCEPYVVDNPTCVYSNVCKWQRCESSVVKAIFDAAPKGDYDNRTNRMDYAVKMLRGSNRLFIFDNAHKLTMGSLQLLMDFHDETQCPIGLPATWKLLDLLERDPQLHSRVGLRWVIGQTRPKELITHLIKSLVPEVGSDLDELQTLCEQVAGKPGHFRAVQKQLKMAVELRDAAPQKFQDWPAAFKAAHKMMLRSYDLN